MCRPYRHAQILTLREGPAEGQPMVIAPAPRAQKSIYAPPEPAYASRDQYQAD